MLIGIPKEQRDEQRLVAATPDSVAKMIDLGYDVCVEAGAGARAELPDAHYERAGARIVGEDVWQADMVVCVDAPPNERLSCMNSGAVLVARMDPGANPALLQACAERGVAALALDAVPRISRAQALDVRSSMMNVAGYRAVIEAANVYERQFTGQMTAAGSTPPAKVYIIGVGVAGLAAIGVAHSLGAQVSATDVRSDVADQVKSLGARFVEIPVVQESSDGYAKEIAEADQQAVLDVYARTAAESDIVITTAQVPHRPAPLLLTAEAVASMSPGSVVVDMSASPLGSNCELTRPGEVFTTDNGVTIVGLMDLPNRMAAQASRLFGQNVVNLLKLLTPQKSGTVVLDEDDEIIRAMTVVLDGRITWPPPPTKVSATPAPAKDAKAAKADEKALADAPDASSAAAVAAAAGADAGANVGADVDGPAPSRFRGWWWKALLAIAAMALILFAPSSMTGHFIVFELAVVVGFYVITNVTHALHTPLMSVTNAISGIIIVGAIAQIGSNDPLIIALAFVAMALASINVFGGFLVTHRMLEMFRRSSEK